MKSNYSELLSCWPDGYSRYYSISNILHIIYASKKLNILDVGGDSQWMSKFLDRVELDYTIKIIDTREQDFETKNTRVKYIREDFFKAKPSDFPVDVVMNTDVLEHIPSELKGPFVNQCITFAKSLAIFSAPQDQLEVTYAEEQIDTHYKKYTKKQQRWLKEHFEFGKPDPTVIEESIKSHGYPYLIINTNNLENWFVSFSINFINSEILGLAGMDALNRFYNQHIQTVGDFTGTPYRKIFVVFKDQALYDESAKKIQDFFKPDASKKITYLAGVFELIIRNIKGFGQNINNQNIMIAKLTNELVEARNSLSSTTTELNNIKASRSYRYIKKINKALGR